MAEARLAQAKEVYNHARNVTSNTKPVNLSGNSKYDERLQLTIKELQAQLEKEQATLREAESSVDKSKRIDLDQASDPKDLLRQQRVITAAYKQLASSKPTLPGKESVLPHLIALRSASAASSGLRALIPETQDELKSARRQLAAEERRLAAFRLLRTTLAARIDELTDEGARQEALSADEVARERIAELRAGEKALHEEANLLGRELRWFVAAHLGPMLAADQLGGPPVGDLQPVTDAALGAGFTDSGRARQVEEATSGELARKGREVREQVSRDFRKLMQDLLNAATGDGVDGSEWVEIPEGLRAVQFLITAKVAMFHPQDARKIRLLGFAE